jgi:hypothetical protein
VLNPVAYLARLRETFFVALKDEPPSYFAIETRALHLPIDKELIFGPARSADVFAEHSLGQRFDTM